MRCLQLARPQKKHKNKIAINLLKDKSAFIPESECLKSKAFKIRMNERSRGLLSKYRHWAYWGKRKQKKA